MANNATVSHIRRLMLDDSTRVVSFDAGFTLIEPHPGVGIVYARVAKDFGLLVDPAWLESRFFKAYERGLEGVRSGQCRSFNTSEKGAREWWRRLAFETFGDAASPEIMPDLAEALFEEYTSARCWRRCSGVPEVLQTIRKVRNDVRLVILSNWDARLVAVLEGMDLADWFDTIYYSSAIGYEKPDSRAFEHVLSDQEVDAEALVHIGDSPHDDYQGALNVGARGLLVKRSRDSRRHAGDYPAANDAVLESLADLQSALSD